MGWGDTKDGVLLAALGEDGCHALFDAAPEVVFAQGQSIFSAGEPGNTMILLGSGRVEISLTSLAGRKSVLAHMGPGEVLGEVAALDGGARSADAVAASAVTGRVLARDNVLAFVTATPKRAEAVLIALCGKVRNASEMFVTQAVVEGEPRLARGLLRLFDRWGEPGKNGRVTLAERFSQQEIGEFSGLARENVNRHIKAWTGDGIVAIEGRQLVLLQRDELEAIADN
ncbi:MAG: Crp/Fnr family transcriptional regulator [Pseudomonadota bacterium]